MNKDLKGLFIGILPLLLALAIPDPAWAPWVPIKGYDVHPEPARNIKGEPVSISLCLDPKNNPHIAWVEENQPGQHEMHYLKWNGSSWVDIDGSGQESIKIFALEANSFSMCLDSAGYPHMAWARSRAIEEDDYLFLASEVYYLRWNGSEWVDVDGAGQESMKVGTGYEYNMPYLCLDSKGRPHLALIKEFANFLSPHICYLRWNGKQWIENRGPGEKGGDIYDVSKVPESLWLHLDSNGQSHIALALQDKDGGRICYLYWIADRKLWGRKFIKYRDPEGYLAPSVCLDSKNYPHIAYLDAVRKQIHYLQWNGREWIDPEAITLSGFIGLLKGKQVENQRWKEELLAGFQEAELGELTTHIGESVDSFSLCLDSKDSPHIAYMDGYWKEIYYLKWIPADNQFFENYMKEKKAKP